MQKKINLNESYGESVVTLDSSKVTAASNLVGNSKANVIKGGKGAGKLLSVDNGDGTIRQYRFEANTSAMYDSANQAQWFVEDDTNFATDSDLDALIGKLS